VHPTEHLYYSFIERRRKVSTSLKFLMNVFPVLFILLFTFVVSCSAAKVAAVPEAPPVRVDASAQAGTPAPQGAPASPSDDVTYKTIRLMEKRNNTWNVSTGG
jgi:hypothetical protein